MNWVTDGQRAVTPRRRHKLVAWGGMRLRRVQAAKHNGPHPSPSDMRHGRMRRTARGKHEVVGNPARTALSAIALAWRADCLTQSAQSLDAAPAPALWDSMYLMLEAVR
mmetsp:Transcript_34307/g.103380  ORF Transcript_34307/g.103380 Transcript_34307/m.103380 type:complete len:109 (-) Transcript_34307:612-938(-)